jgi:hypothetical protein
MPTRRDTTPTNEHIEKGASLARGPAWIVGTVLSVFGLILFFKVQGTPLSTAGFSGGTAEGQKLLGFEANAWTAWGTTAAGVLVLIGSAQHLFARTVSLIVGVALGAAALIALFDGDDVFGLAAANGLTELGWGIAAAVLIITALLPRLRHKRTDETAAAVATRDRDRGAIRDHNDAAAREYDEGRVPAGAATSRDHDTHAVAGHRASTRDYDATPEADRVDDRNPVAIGNEDETRVHDRTDGSDHDRAEQLAADRAADRDRDATAVDGDRGAHGLTEPPTRTGRFQRGQGSGGTGADGNEEPTSVDGSRVVQIPPARRE